VNTKLKQRPSAPLFPCPFCAGEGRLFVHELAGMPELEPIYQIECEDCGATGPGRDSPFDAEKWWNRKMLVQAIRDRIGDERP
jgi:hypothetical protein